MNPLINDSQRLVSAKGRFGHNIPVYDDGYGPLFIHRDSMGISGIVRARTWEDAYGICEDEFFPEASETIEEIRKEYNFKRESKKVVKCVRGTPIDPHLGINERFVEDKDYDDNGGRLPDGMFVRWQTIETPCEDENGWAENELFQEAFGFRPNGPRSGTWQDGAPRDPVGHGIYAKDLNGDALDTLTPELLAELEITLEIQDEE